MPELVLQASIQIRGINPYVFVTAEQAALIQSDWRKPLPVLVKINDAEQEWQTNMMPNGEGAFYLYLHGEMRSASHTQVGDILRLRIRFHEAYRNGPLHPMPIAFQEALDRNPTAAKHWENLSPSRQKEVLRYFAGLQSSLAKERNIIRAIEALGSPKSHFMGRDWVDGK